MHSETEGEASVAFTNSQASTQLLPEYGIESLTAQLWAPAPKTNGVAFPELFPHKVRPSCGNALMAMVHFSGALPVFKNLKIAISPVWQFVKAASMHGFTDAWCAELMLKYIIPVCVPGSEPEEE
ncbi:MAG: hypothetical protein PHF51_04780 [Candidatus ainarchaeum sp.]|nr:hypothetical protein [Candidatus ainarchaeum sp.]